MNVYTNEKIEVDGVTISFDGVGHDDTLKVYRYNGETSVVFKALKKFCINNGYNTLKIK